MIQLLIWKMINQSTLNQLFISNLSVISNRRDAFAKEKRLRDEKEKLALQKKNEQQRKLDEQKKKDELIKKQFSPWDGSHRNLTNFIKDNLKDPDSYEHIKTVYFDKGDHLIVITSYRGNNSYGGKVVESITAKVDFKGNVIEIIPN